MLCREPDTGESGWLPEQVLSWSREEGLAPSSADWNRVWDRPCHWWEGMMVPWPGAGSQPDSLLGLPPSHRGQFCRPWEGLPWGT